MLHFLTGHDKKIKENIKDKIALDILIGDTPTPDALKTSSGKEMSKYVREHVGSQFTGYLIADPKHIMMVTDDGGMFGGIFTCYVNPYTSKIVGNVNLIRAKQ